MTTETSINAMQRHLLTIEKLRTRVRQMLQCVINLHIEFLVLESNVSQLIDEVKDFNDELLEVQRLDELIIALRNYNGPTICHEWPYPLIFKGTIDDADVAQILNGKQRIGSKSRKSNDNKVSNGFKSRVTMNTTASLVSNETV
ncbi:uncharacterized protein LOC118747724 isoform X1 [Rhagoletis pomonella]|uniref:uncharacterized protein LOC118747724 isoform X1 n=1 Tax=Rhagoletis pomonella TaxID=28610 RepID=UPI00177D6118|nr:uncharacterized protein LOC118747724 isoform X1 [Rhagoletis pomonella]XP_036337722.1 uncharacterized protein LOC118747724 isoform X1 [Rhagoletis pomonella]